MAVEAPVHQPAPLQLSERRRRRLATTGLLSGPLLWLSVFFLAPVVLIALYSVNVLSLYPGEAGFTFAAWTDFINGSVYLGLFWKSVRMALIVSALVVVLAYPVAYALALCATKRKYVLLLVLIAPAFVSYFLRILAWKVILGDQGVINSFAYWTGVRDPDHPIPQLLYSQFSVMLVLAYVWIPFVALPIFVALENLDRRLLEAASDLGATRWQAFRRVTLPLSMPGVVAAFIFIFIPTIGEYFAPLLVGGTSGSMFGNAIADQFGASLNWLQGSVFSFFLLVVVGILMAVFARFLTVKRMATG